MVILQYKCEKCNHSWKSRKERKPKICPNCKSAYWEIPSKRMSKDFIIKNNELLVNLHDLIIKESGGEYGVRDEGGIYNSMFKIWNYSKIHYKEPTKVGALVFEELAKRHHFVDGNKRTAYCFTKSILITSGYHLKIKYTSAVDFILQIANHNNPKTLKEIEEWLKKYVTIIPKDAQIDIYLKDLLYEIRYGQKNRENEND